VEHTLLRVACEKLAFSACLREICAMEMGIFWRHTE
jgi:hypothetical protein